MTEHEKDLHDAERELAAADELPALIRELDEVRADGPDAMVLRRVSTLLRGLNRLRWIGRALDALEGAAPLLFQGGMDPKAEAVETMAGELDEQLRSYLQQLGELLDTDPNGRD